MKPGETITVALRLKIIPHWHTYWRNPGDSGEPTQLEWRLPPGVTAGPMQWPAPWRLPAGPLMNFGYEDEVLHLVDVAVPANATGKIALAAHARWLVCNPERCIPEVGEVGLELPVGAGGATPWAGAIARARGALPVKAQGLRLAATRSAAGVDLEIDPPPHMVAYFRSSRARSTTRARRPGTAGPEIPRSQQPVGASSAWGLLVMDRRAVEIDVPWDSPRAAAGPGHRDAVRVRGRPDPQLMPCVHAGAVDQDPGIRTRDEGSSGLRAMRAHGMLYGLGGVLRSCFFAALLILLQSLGHQIGWGFQLQSPVFVALLLALFLALALNLSGFFEFSFVLSSELKSKSKHVDAFLTGMLAVVVASPCTAPFMGAALGYALAGGPAEAIVVFTALGIGMALPYVVLAWNPGWLRWVPKPGA